LFSTKIQSLPRISENIVISILHKILDLTDEIGFRRQNRAFFTSKRRRDRVSSPKSHVFHPKLATRLVPY
ncbi:hypothetical protein P5F77_01545, partial [Caldifermentibacillus hisashii]|uniref:hypothetical protein n=1 Tax=Caldifermentibacillus hisashii TaxID=996558 RepID=UPI0030D63101